jgi:uncharacterized phage-associated protein
MSEIFDDADQVRSLRASSVGMAGELQFVYDLTKVVNALAFFAGSGVKDLTRLKAAKLLYLADRYHFLRYGRPISGDRYIAMDLGPVPENTYQFTTRLMEPDEVEDAARAIATQKLDVYHGLLRQYKYPVLRARSAADMSVFSDSEIEALRATVDEFGSTPARALVEITHGHNAYLRANRGRVTGSSVPLPYEFFLADAQENQAEMIRELAVIEQEDRDVAASLKRAARAAKARELTQTGR